MSPWLLLILGLLLIYIEFFLPGAIMGICGGLFVLASIVAFIMQSDSILENIAYVIFTIASMIALIKFAIWRIRTAKPGKSIYSDDSQVGYQASEYDHSTIGKEGIAATDLKPGGYVFIDGKRQQAISQTGYIVKGSNILVISGQEESLIVKIQKHKEQ